jgi:lysozyme
MVAGEAAYALIREFEGLKLEAYQCSAKVWTIGYGHTTGIRRGMRCTVEQAEKWLKADVEEAERGARMLFNKWPLTPNQFDALVSFVFNIGAPRISGSGIHSLINHGDMAIAADRLLAWNMADGKVSEGLTRRRKAERELFLRK